MKRIADNFALTSFRTYLADAERAPATIGKYLRDVKKFYSFSGIGAEITKETTIEYKNWLQERYQISSANSMLASLNHFFRFMGWTELSVKPFKQQQQSFRSSDRELSREEYVRLTQTAQRKGQIWLYLIMVTLCATGIRISELPFITVESLSTRQAIVRNNIHHAMKKLCEEAGVKQKKVFPHNLRHLFAVEHYEKHRDLSGLANILGHSNINTTRIYIMVTIERKEEEMDALGLVV